MSLFRTRTPDPDATRMSFGDHLEELRRRIIYALVGFIAAVVLCFNFGGIIIETLTTPYYIAMHQQGFDPRMVQLNPIESFVEYFKITMEFALVLSAPWILYQLWLFVAAGLYASEQRIVKLFAPTSILLFVIGASFMVLIVLSGLLAFLINISTWFPLPSPDNFLYRWLAPPAVVQMEKPPTDALPVSIPVLSDDPTSPADGEMWINRRTRRICVQYDGEVHYSKLQPAARQQFVEPFFSISQYLGFVVSLALAFGLGFQIPIVVVFLITLGLVPAEQLAAARRHVLIGVLLFSAILTPTPDIATMLLLAVPMYLLYEAGLIVGRTMNRNPDAQE